MLLSRLLRLIGNRPAIYFATTPLFSPHIGIRLLPNGTYTAPDEGTSLTFDWADDHYVMQVGEPWTVAIYPLETEYLFQQSVGVGTAFYGAIRFASGASDFRIFSPEATLRRSLRAASEVGAKLHSTGCEFDTGAQLRRAMLRVIAEAPDSTWNSYRAS